MSEQDELDPSGSYPGVSKKQRAYFERTFVLYHPYLTYADTENDSFISPKGESLGELTDDTLALFRIGQKAFDLLTAEKSEEEIDERGESVGFTMEGFDKAFVENVCFIDSIRKLLTERYEADGFVCKDEFNQTATPDFDEMGADNVLSIGWRLIEAGAKNNPVSASIRDLLRNAFLFHVLKEVDVSLLGMQCDFRGAVASAIAAADSLSDAMTIDSGNDALKKARSTLAYQGAMERIKRDPKQKEKEFVKSCWEDWQKTPSNYEGKAAFARDMLSKCEQLKSQKKIEDWCRKWEKE